MSWRGVLPLTLILSILVGLLPASARTALAHPYPPTWQAGAGASVHHAAELF